MSEGAVGSTSWVMADRSQYGYVLYPALQQAEFGGSYAPFTQENITPI